MSEHARHYEWRRSLQSAPMAEPDRSLSIRSGAAFCFSGCGCTLYGRYFEEFYMVAAGHKVRFLDGIALWGAAAGGQCRRLWRELLRKMLPYQWSVCICSTILRACNPHALMRRLCKSYVGRDTCIGLWRRLLEGSAPRDAHRAWRYARVLRAIFTQIYTNGFVDLALCMEWEMTQQLFASFAPRTHRVAARAINPLRISVQTALVHRPQKGYRPQSPSAALCQLSKYAL